MADMVVLKAVFDDSDIMVDYFNSDRSMFSWFVCDLEGRVTEGKLRKALKLLPNWLQAFEWTYRKGEVYSMSDHPYGQLRVDKGLRLTVKGEHTYSHSDRSLRFILTATFKSCFNMNNSITEPIPETKQRLSQMLEAKEQEWSLRRREQKQRIREAQVKTIESSHAVIDGKGFHILTAEEKKQQIEDYQKKCILEDKQERERIKNRNPKNLEDFLNPDNN